MFCALLAPSSLCIGILQFISVELFTFSFCVGIIHIISVEHFYGAKVLGEGCGDVHGAVHHHLKDLVEGDKAVVHHRPILKLDTLSEPLLNVNFHGV